MFDDIFIQMLAETPRRPLSVWGIISGRKTASVLFAGLEYGILQWQGLTPQCPRSAILSATAKLVQAGYATDDGTAIALTQSGLAEKRRAAVRTPLPVHYAPDNNVRVFGNRLFLAVQAVSEAMAGNAQYVPVSADWQVQRYVRSWYKHWATRLQDVASELTAAFARLPEQTADNLAGQFVGHGYNGRVQASDWLTNLDELSALVQVVWQNVKTMPALAALWGGPTPQAGPKAEYCVQLFESGQSLETIAQELGRKQSTVNEYLLTYAILVRPLAPELLASAGQIAALTASWAAGVRSYQELLQCSPELTFMQVRLFQIAQLRREASKRG
ncbi:helix-turn-helix domain-containing protein [Lacticaseibacillus hulanensis]|uniref:helix-turn-helix domain-containing protein n=1 Tax=Lacticaseibacillus hulanensis TaxID=2493111 RepID=UPI0013E3714F|nr:helix-turn-helix domain-containing protein [Lacticaseibacillus hulanensis]